jgi:hypothetical protein
MVYDHRETGLYTNGVRTLGSVREGRRALVTVGSGSSARRHIANREIGVPEDKGTRASEVPKSRRNRDRPLEGRVAAIERHPREPDRRSVIGESGYRRSREQRFRA